MNFFLLSCALFAVLSAGNGFSNSKAQSISQLEKLVPEVKKSLGNSWQSVMTKVNLAIQNDQVMSSHELQDRKSFQTNFNVGTNQFKCSTKSNGGAVPTSVHKLRPEDIKVVAAVGDSITAGNGILAKSILGLLVQYRGSSFSVGGEHTLDKQVTIPNILKKYNTRITGHSTGSGSVDGLYSNLNLAVPGNKAVHMPQQARDLITRMKADSKINFQNDWKLITLFIGGNDLCDYCKDKKEYSTENYKKYIQEALDILHRDVPRALVNVLEVVDVGLVEELKDGSFTCGTLLGSMLCSCVAKPENNAAKEEIKRKVKEYQEAVRQLADSGRYDTRDDFTVVNQPFFRNTAPPRINGKFDLSYFAPDCFHFSAKGHAESAKALWNNMLEPVGKKSSSWSVTASFNCPTQARPYFATNKN